MARPKCFVSRWKVQRKALDAGKHERSAIARPAEAQPVFGLHASFEAARHAPLMGGRRLSIAHPKYGLLTWASPTTLMSALARALKEKGSREVASQRARGGAGWKPEKGGSASGEADRAGQRPLRPRSRRTKGYEKEGAPPLRRDQASNCAPPAQGRRFCRIREKDGRQRLALKRQPPCGGRGCGCRASWPCRRDCR